MKKIVTVAMKEDDEGHVRLSLRFHRRLKPPEALAVFKDLTESVMKAAFNFADSLGISREESAKLFAMQALGEEAIETYRRHYPEEGQT